MVHRSGAEMHHFWREKKALRKNEQNTITEAFEIGETKSITLQDLDFVIAAFSKSVGILVFERIDNRVMPISICRCAFFEGN